MIFSAVYYFTKYFVWHVRAARSSHLQTSLSSSHLKGFRVRLASTQCHRRESEKVRFKLASTVTASERKMNDFPCSSRCWPSGDAAGKRPLLLLFLYSRTRRPRRPGARRALTESGAAHAGSGWEIFTGKPGRQAVTVTPADFNFQVVKHG